MARFSPPHPLRPLRPPRFARRSDHVRLELQDVQYLRANDAAFCAVRGDRTPVTWGDGGAGGRLAEGVRERLRPVGGVVGWVGDLWTTDREG